MNKEKLVELVSQSKRFKSRVTSASESVSVCLKNLPQTKEMIEHDFIGYSHLCEKLEEIINQAKNSQTILARVEISANKMNSHAVQLAETQLRQTLNLYTKDYKTSVDEVLQFWGMARKIEELATEAHSMCINNSELDKAKSNISNWTSDLHDWAKGLAEDLNFLLDILDSLSK